MPARRKAKTTSTELRPRGIEQYGWIPDIPDQRDYMYAAPPQFLGKLPTKVDLTRQCPLVYEQGQLGSCMAHAIGAAIEFDQLKQKVKLVATEV